MIRDKDCNSKLVILEMVSISKGLIYIIKYIINLFTRIYFDIAL